METISNYPMNVTDCYKCGYFRKGGHFTCQKFPHPHNVEHPTDDPNARYLVPAPVTWRNPDGKDIHCNSFVEYVKDTLFQMLTEASLHNNKEHSKNKVQLEIIQKYETKSTKSAETKDE